jgi:hypothetical protein
MRGGGGFGPGRGFGRCGLGAFGGVRLGARLRVVGARIRGARVRGRATGARTGVRAARTGELAERGAWEGELGHRDLVDLEENTRFLRGVQSRNLHQFITAGFTSSATGDFQLSTVDEELGATDLRAQMERDQLVAEEIISWGELSGNRGGCELTVVDVALVPGLAVGLDALLFSLEPFGFGSVEVAARGITAGRHVGHDGALVVDPLALAVTCNPFDLNFRTGFDFSNVSASFGTLSTNQVLVVDTQFDRLDGVDHAERTSMRRHGVRVVAFVGFPADGHLGDITMGRNERGQEEGGSDEEGGCAHHHYYHCWLIG